MTTKRIRLTRRTKLLLWMAFGVSLPFIWVLSVLFSDPAPIRISRETTYLTEPVHPSGYVDLTDEVNRLLAEATAGNRLLDPEPLRKALADLEAAVDVDQLDGWNPQYDEQLDAVAAAVRISTGNLQLKPIPQNSDSTWPGLQWAPYDFVGHENGELQQLVDDAFRKRIRQRLENGDLAGVRRDCSNIADIQRFFLRQLWFTQAGFASLIQADVAADFADYLSEGILRPEDCIRCLDLFNGVETEDVGRFIEHDRLSAINFVCMFHAESWPVPVRGSPIVFRNTSGVPVDVASRWIRGRVDWNEVAMRVNDVFDRIDAEIPAKSQTERNLRLDKLVGLPGWRNAYQTLGERWAFLSTEDTTALVTALVLDWNTDSVQNLHLVTKGTKVTHLVKLAALIEQHRQRTDKLPDSANNIDGWRNAGTPAFTPRCVYHKTPEGFELVDARDSSVLLQWEAGEAIVVPGVSEYRN